MGRRTSEQLWAAKRVPKKRGEGSVFPIKVNGQTKYRATYTLFMDDQGRAVQVSGTGNSEEEAIRRRDANYKKRLVQMGQVPVSALGSRPKELKFTTADVLRQWLEWKSRQTSSSQRISLNVIAQYKAIIELHLLPEIGSIPIRLLDRKAIEILLFERLPSKVNPKTSEPVLGASRMRTLQSVLNMACRWAFEERIILENPTIGVPKLDKPKSKVGRERLDQKYWFTYRLATRLRGHEDEARWLFTFLLAIRQSERLGLEWSCFRNLNKPSAQATVEIRQQLDRNPNTGELYIKQETKTAAGQRIIPLDARLVEIVNSYRRRQAEWRRSPEWNPRTGLEDLVFTMRTGQPIRHQTDNKQWRKLLEANNIPYTPQHNMRHLAISMMVANGEPIEIVRAIAGHHAVEITRSVYTHLSASSKVKTLEGLVDRVFREREQEAARKMA